MIYKQGKQVCTVLWLNITTDDITPPTLNYLSISLAIYSKFGSLANSRKELSARTCLKDLIIVPRKKSKIYETHTLQQQLAT